MSDTADGEATQSFDEFIDEAGKKSAEMVIHFVENLSLKREKKQPIISSNENDGCFFLLNLSTLNERFFKYLVLFCFNDVKFF